MPLCSRLRPDVRDRQTSDRQTDKHTSGVKQHHRLMPPPRGRGIIIIIVSNNDVILYWQLQLFCLLHTDRKCILNVYKLSATHAQPLSIRVTLTFDPGLKTHTLKVTVASTLFELSSGRSRVYTRINRQTDGHSTTVLLRHVVDLDNELRVTMPPPLTGGGIKRCFCLSRTSGLSREQTSP